MVSSPIQETFSVCFLVELGKLVKKKTIEKTSHRKYRSGLNNESDLSRLALLRAYNTTFYDLSILSLSTSAPLNLQTLRTTTLIMNEVRCYNSGPYMH